MSLHSPVCRQMTSNKPLVPTRTGEAPLLAAQRRRWAEELHKFRGRTQCLK